MSKILLIGHGKSDVAFFADALNGAEFEFEYVTSEAKALDSLAFSEPDLILIEFVAPDPRMLSLCQHLRRLCTIPIVVCSRNGREYDVVRALEAGADDYMAMPIRPVELAARLRALLRRAVERGHIPLNGRHLIAGDIELKLNTHEVLRRGLPLELSPIEFKLLALLVRETGRAVSHSRLIAHVWGSEYVDCRHYLRLYIRYLRAKVEDNPEAPELILNEWGVGYRFEPKAPA